MAPQRLTGFRTPFFHSRRAFSLLAILIGSVLHGYAEEKTWIGGSNFWDTATAWNPEGIPGSGDTAVIAGASSHVILTNAATIEALRVTNGATLTFSNLNAVVEATEVMISSGGTVTHVINSDTNETDGWQVDGRVYIVCSNFTLASDGMINVDYKGFQPIGTGKGAGPGGGQVAAGSKNPGGGGHGGRGGDGWLSSSPGGIEYDSTNQPAWPGSAGGGSPQFNLQGAPGGGLVWIIATNAQIDGTVSASGANGFVDPNSGRDGSGGGAGGGIFIQCATLSGNGTLRAKGGVGGNWSGGGAGGRIALVYENSTWNGSIQAHGGPGSWPENYPLVRRGGIGTLYDSSPDVIRPVLNAAGFRFVGPSNDLFLTSLTLTNGAHLVCSLPNVRLFVGNNLVISGSDSALDLGGTAGDTPRTLLSVGGDLTIAGGTLFVRSGITNQIADDDQELVRVEGTLLVTNGGVIYPYSYQFPPQRTNAGGSVRFEVGNLLVSSNSMINAKGLGFGGGRSAYGSGGFGPGGAPPNWNAGGGGHGGRGGDGWPGNGAKPGGVAYGSSNAPALAGSGGGQTGGYSGGDGGGLVRVKASGTIQIDGTINADATDPQLYGGGGAGGGVYLYCYKFKGSGTITAKGSKAGEWSGGGGGGRIAIWCRVNRWSGTPIDTNSVAAGPPDTKNGPFYPVAEAGTVVFVQLPPAGTLIMIQ